MKLNLSSLFLIVLITFQFLLQITYCQLDNFPTDCPQLFLYHPNCKEAFPTKCALNEWKVGTGNDVEGYVYKTDHNFSISCGKLLSSYYIEY